MSLSPEKSTGYSASLMGSTANTLGFNYTTRSRIHQYSDISDIFWGYKESSSEIVLEGRNLSRIKTRLFHLSKLLANWDGEGALPISRKVLLNIKKVLQISNDSDWQNWLIGADTNATLGLQSKITDACISIGEEDYSYYAEINKGEFHGNHIHFSPISFLDTMRRIG